MQKKWIIAGVIGLIVLLGIFGSQGSKSQGNNLATNCPTAPDFSNRIFLRVITSGEYVGNERYLLLLRAEDGWSEGFKLKTQAVQYIDCNKGSRQGENLNYLYCRYALLEKTETTQSGEIGKTTTLSITPIFDVRQATKTQLSKAPSDCNSCSSDGVDWFQLKEAKLVDAPCKEDKVITDVSDLVS